VNFGLDVATTGEWGDIRRLVALAVEAEAAGWDGFFPWDVFLTDDDSPVADPWVTLAAIASSTTRIRLGAMVTPLVRRNPWEVARTVASLDQLSGGRMVLGVGLGSGIREFERLSLPVDLRQRAEYVDEALDIIDRLWAGQTVTARGGHYTLDGVAISPLPVQRPRVPIWTAAGWPRRRPLRRAMRWDGVYLMTNNQLTDERLTPAEVAGVAALIRSERTAQTPFDIAANVFTPDEPDGGLAITRAMAGAGATWTLELTPATFEHHEQLVRRGPVRI
jgi:alkanesulfonate monooxygenase SsuD/methylene tetrahydromethanopterin reductase-like flavin-dependent oxidoreductase (luciferase family)